jgi:Domain of unknown function (DUF2804), C-terminal
VVETRYGRPLDQSSLPLFDHGQLRKRWRYVAAFDERVMLCAARAEVGPLSQSFWVLWDREGRRQWAHTAVRPGSREVLLEGPLLEIDAAGLRATLRLGEVEPIEVTCPSGASSSWTRKRAGMRVAGTIEVPGSRWELDARGIDDESAGHHARHTRWHWSAGIGSSVEGRPLAWNLVAGINDPPRGSERAIWVDGRPEEPPPCHFDGIGSIDVGAAGAMSFVPESDHARDDNYLLLRSRYRHRFGSFTGSLAGHELASGLGVMEKHDARW